MHSISFKENKHKSEQKKNNIKYEKIHTQSIHLCIIKEIKDVRDVPR